MSTVKPIPNSSSVVMPMLVCRDVAAAIDFCKTAFGAVELGRRPGPDGIVAHALLTISGAMVIVEAEWPTLASRAPQPDGSSPVVIFVYVEDVDQVVERAVAAGAKVVLPVKNQFWGDRTGADYGSVGACVDHRHSRRRDFVRGEGAAVVQDRQRLTSYAA
jgi:PhnB protein